MKKNDLIKVIREIVKQEIKKELPIILTQVFTNLIGKSQPAIPSKPNTIKPIEKNHSDQSIDDEENETAMLKEQLKEMFNGNLLSQQIPKYQQKQFTKNPILNEVLNGTRPFNSSEKMAMRAGGMPMVSGFDAMPTPSSTGVGEMMASDELKFLNNIPPMPGSNDSVVSEIPVGRVQLREGQEGGPAPLESISQVSALDIKNHPSLPDNIKGILNRDYRSLVRAMDKKK